VDRVYTDTASRKDTKRAALAALLTFVREGDTLVVHSMDPPARNLDDLRRLVQHLTQRGVHITFVKELQEHVRQARLEQDVACHGVSLLIWAHHTRLRLSD